MKMDKCDGMVTDVLVPTETIEEQLKGGKKKTSSKKFFPGYLLVKTELNDESWHFLRKIPKVIGFVGGKVKDGKLDPDSVPTAGDDASEAHWVPLDQVTEEEIAGDHILIINMLRE